MVARVKEKKLGGAEQLRLYEQQGGMRSGHLTPRSAAGHSRRRRSKVRRNVDLETDRRSMPVPLILGKTSRSMSVAWGGNERG